MNSHFEACQLSNGWTWRLIATPDGEYVLEQFHEASPTPARRSFSLSPKDLSSFVSWLWGSYSAEEWPPERRLSHGFVQMEPNPRPELYVQWYRGRPSSLASHLEAPADAPQATLVLYEKDLSPLVEWLSKSAPVLEARGRI